MKRTIFLNAISTVDQCRHDSPEYKSDSRSDPGARSDTGADT